MYKYLKIDCSSLKFILNFTLRQVFLLNITFFAPKKKYGKIFDQEYRKIVKLKKAYAAIKSYIKPRYKVFESVSRQTSKLSLTNQLLLVKD